MCMDNLTDPQLEKDNSFLTILPNLEFAFPCFTLCHQTNFSKHCFLHVTTLLKSLLSA